MSFLKNEGSRNQIFSFIPIFTIIGFTFSYVALFLIVGHHLILINDQRSLMGALFFSMKISAGSDHIFVDFFLSIHKCLIQSAMSNAYLIFSRQLDTNFFINWYLLKLRKPKLAKKLIKIKHFFQCIISKTTAK